jgi:hypothetical protein
MKKRRRRRREKEEALAGLGWLNYPPWGMVWPPHGNKKKKKKNLAHGGGSATMGKHSIFF